MSIDQYSTTPANNDLVNYFKTGMRPSAVKNAGWDIMADIASYLVSLPNAGGTANALTVANGRPFGSLVAGLTQILNPSAVNTGAATFAPDGLTAKNIFAWKQPLIGGELQIGVPAILRYDGTQWNLENPANGYTEMALFTANGNFVPKISGNYFVMAQGGGGGGGGGTAIGATSAAVGLGGFGGAAGGLGMQIYSLTAGTSYPVVIGAAGASGAAQSDGGDGGSTNFNGSFVGVAGLGGSVQGSGGRGQTVGVTFIAGSGMFSGAGGDGGGSGGGKGAPGLSSDGAGTTGTSAVNNSGAGGGGGSGGRNSAGTTLRAGGAGGGGGTGWLFVMRC